MPRSVDNCRTGTCRSRNLQREADANPSSVFDPISGSVICDASMGSNESVPKIVINRHLFFIQLQSTFSFFQTMTVSECCLINCFRIFYLKKFVYILALEMASQGNRHCANCIGALSFPMARILWAASPARRCGPFLHVSHVAWSAWMCAVHTSRPILCETVESIKMSLGGSLYYTRK